jgi:Transposase IS116/IS110/IS902 family
LREGLFRLTDTDLTRIDSIDVMTATTIVSEAGYDMSKWETEHHFVSWLRLCPDNRISGAKVIGKGRLPTNNPISIALKMAASSLRRCQARSVSGLTMVSAERQPLQMRQSQTHNKRSARVSFGRFLEDR